jgi:hypothetical protein
LEKLAELAGDDELVAQLEAEGEAALMAIFTRSDRHPWSAA